MRAGRGEVVVVGCREHDLLRRQPEDIDGAEVDGIIALVGLEGVRAQYKVPRQSGPAGYAYEQKQRAIGERANQISSFQPVEPGEAVRPWIKPVPEQVDVGLLFFCECATEAEFGQDLVQALTVDNVERCPRPLSRLYPLHTRPVAGSPGAGEGVPVNAVDAFLGGEMSLDPGAANTALAGAVAENLGVDVSRAAWGVHEVINEDVARAFRVHASEIGFDYRRCTMVAFGGSGPAHAMRVARKLRIPKVIFPVGAGVMSAIGLLTVPISFATLRSGRLRLDNLDESGLVAGFAPVEDQARALLEEAGVSLDGITMERRLDMRFYGQGHEVEVSLPEEVTPAMLGDLFLAAYAETFATMPLDAGIEIVNWKIEASGPTPDFESRYRPYTAPTNREMLIRQVRIFDPNTQDFVECPVYDRYALATGVVIDGPALIQEDEATTVLGSGERIGVDSFGNLVASFVQGDN